LRIYIDSYLLFFQDSKYRNLEKPVINKYKTVVIKMSLPSAAKEILEILWKHNKPIKASEIAKEVGVNFPHTLSVMMHTLGLSRMGYIKTLKNGYVITQTGREFLGFTEMDRKKAQQILAKMPEQKAFQFYRDIGKPLNINAISLTDFYNKILYIDINSLEFHINRGDFESWFTALGSLELAKKTLLLKKQKISKAELRDKFSEIVKKCHDDLLKISLSSSI
jgi:predicted transcriptional regulator